MTDGEVPPAQAQDPIAARAHDYSGSRDGCRTPMLWDSGPGWGFTSGDQAWLPFGDRTPAQTAAVQREDPDSILHRYRALIAWRRETADLHDAEVAWLTDEGPVIAYRSGEHVVAACCGDAEASLDLPAGTWTIRVATDRRRDGEEVSGRLSLGPAEAVVLGR